MREKKINTNKLFLLIGLRICGPIDKKDPKVKIVPPRGGVWDLLTHRSLFYFPSHSFSKEKEKTKKAKTRTSLPQVRIRGTIFKLYRPLGDPVILQMPLMCDCESVRLSLSNINVYFNDFINII